jgi:hypothetical protein
MTVQDALVGVRGKFSGALVSSSQFDSIAALAGTLPYDTVAVAGFERRLRDPSARADFSVMVQQDGADQHNGARRGIERLSVDLLAATRSDTWGRIAAFAADWQEGDLEALRHAYLEFDTSKDGDAMTSPNILFSVKPRMGPAAVQRFVGAVLIGLAGDAAACTSQEIIDMVARAQGHFNLVDIGVMLSRNPVFVRIGVTPVLTQEVEGGLRAFGYPCVSERLLRFIRDLFAHKVDSVRLAFDFSTRLLPRLGVECYVAERPPWDSRRTTIFMRRLVEAGLCDSEEVELLTRAIPRHLPADPELDPVTALRTICYFKIVMDRDEPVDAKVYLYAFVKRSATAVRRPADASAFRDLMEPAHAL